MKDLESSNEFNDEKEKIIKKLNPNNHRSIFTRAVNEDFFKQAQNIGEIEIKENNPKENINT